MSTVKTTYDTLCEAIKPQNGELQPSKKLFVRLCALVFEDNGLSFEGDTLVKTNDTEKKLGYDFQTKLFAVINEIPQGEKEQATINLVGDINKKKAWLEKWGPQFVNDFVKAMNGKLPDPQDCSVQAIVEAFKKYGKPVIDRYTKPHAFSGLTNIFNDYWSGLSEFADGKSKSSLDFIKDTCIQIAQSVKNKLKSK